VSHRSDGSAPLASRRNSRPARGPPPVACGADDHASRAMTVEARSIRSRLRRWGQLEPMRLPDAVSSGRAAGGSRLSDNQASWRWARPLPRWRDFVRAGAPDPTLRRSVRRRYKDKGRRPALRRRHHCTGRRVLAFSRRVPTMCGDPPSLPGVIRRCARGWYSSGPRGPSCVLKVAIDDHASTSRSSAMQFTGSSPARQSAGVW